MIILDLSQVMISNLMVQLGNHTNTAVEESMLRHMVLNSLRSNKQKFGDQYGEMIIACDNHNYWRKQIFPNYKAHRRKNIAESEIDWKSIFESMARIKGELKESFPYRVIDVEGAEADDVIATLVQKFGEDADDIVNLLAPDLGKRILILSGDKDFVQLQKYSNVVQYDPIRKKELRTADPARFLFEHVLNGDASDGVPNVLSNDDCFVKGERQKPLTKKRISQFMSMTRNELLKSPIKRNYARNETLIDLSYIPANIGASVMEQYEAQSGRDRSKLMNYFMHHRLNTLMERINEF